MNSQALKKKVNECVADLEKLASIKFGQKWSVTGMAPISQTVSNKVMRACWSNDSKETTKTYIKTVYENSFMILNSIFDNISNYIPAVDFPKSKLFKQINKLMTHIPSANMGVNNLKGSYSDQEDFTDWISAHIKSVNNKMTNLHRRFQTYLVSGGLIDPSVLKNNTSKPKKHIQMFQIDKELSKSEPIPKSEPINIVQDVESDDSLPDEPAKKPYVDLGDFEDSSEDSSSQHNSNDVMQFVATVANTPYLSDNEIF
jgi:hypothetical protein